jgi:hypothetical protein
MNPSFITQMVAHGSPEVPHLVGSLPAAHDCEAVVVEADGHRRRLRPPVPSPSHEDGPMVVGKERARLVDVHVVKPAIIGRCGSST